MHSGMKRIEDSNIENSINSLKNRKKTKNLKIENSMNSLKNIKSR